VHPLTNCPKLSVECGFVLFLIFESYLAISITYHHKYVPKYLLCEIFCIDMYHRYFQSADYQLVLSEIGNSAVLCVPRDSSTNLNYF